MSNFRKNNISKMLTFKVVENVQLLPFIMERMYETRPILHPTEGNIDFSSLFASMPPYIGETVTLESPVMLPDGTHDLNKLNRSLSFIRKKINES